MTEAERLTRILEEHAPLVASLLSDIGRRAAFPRGIPYQSAQAKGVEINATMGQVTDGRGMPVPLPELQGQTRGLDPSMAWLYSPQAGHTALREAWAERQRAMSGGSTVPTSLPMVTSGLTQVLSYVAELFADGDTEVLIPALHWGNYDLIFSLRVGAKISTFRQFDDAYEFSVADLARQLEARRDKKVVVLLNFPHNPTGYSPTVAEAKAIVDLLVAHPGKMIVLCDDAYHGMNYEPGLMERSLFWDLAERHDPTRHLIVRADGSTKELLFFPGRVAFLTHTVTGEAAQALESKFKCLGRSNVGAPVGPSQALVYQALQQPTVHDSFQERMALLAVRYRRLKTALATLGSPYKAYPFNSGSFALVALDPSVPVEPLRRTLLERFDTGVVVFSASNTLRIAYCSLHVDDIDEMVDRLRRAVV